jgi:hypothetical protein
MKGLTFIIIQKFTAGVNRQFEEFWSDFFSRSFDSPGQCKREDKQLIQWESLSKPPVMAGTDSRGKGDFIIMPWCVARNLAMVKPRSLNIVNNWTVNSTL